MNIGDVAKTSGVSAKMVRYYESVGLIAPAARSGSGYRVYTQTDVHRLQFIRRARDFGLSMDRTRQLLNLWQDSGRASSDVKRLALQHVGELRSRISELTAMADALQELADHCHGDSRPECPILMDLAENTAGPVSHSPASRRLRNRSAVDG